MTSTRLITLLLVLWHGSQICAADTKVKGVRRNTNNDSEGASGSGNGAAKARHQALRKFYKNNRLLQTNPDSRDDAGFLSSGLFGSFSDFRGPNEDGSWTLPGGSSDSAEEATSSTTPTTRPPTSQARGDSNGGALASYGSYYGGLGHAFQGGFPITCRPREEGRMKGIVKKGKKGQKNAKGASKGKKGEKGAKSGGSKEQGKGKGGKYKSYSKGSKGSRRSGKGKGSKGSSRSGKGKGSKGSSRSGKGKGGGYYGGFLSRARYFNGVSNGSIHTPTERPNRRRSGYVSVRRSDILDMECYFGAFPPFSGIPVFPAKPPSIAPSQGPPTIFATQTPSVAVNQTSEPTSGSTVPPTISPTVATLSPTIAPSLPLATIAPTRTTSAPTAATSQPTAATLAPTASTSAPTAATASPTVATATPSESTSAPTAATIAPTATPVGATNVTLLSLLNYGYFEDAGIDRAPTQEETDGLIEQTILFYSELFTTTYGDDFVQFRFILNESTNDFERNLPFQMDFDAVVTFGPNIEMEQTPRDVFLVMEASQELYQRYITEFVWNAAPEGTQFGETREVMFEAKAGQF